jgi:hypothetical protein
VGVLATTVSYATADGSAVAPSDYTAKSATIKIAAGSTSKTFTVTTKGQGIDEYDEYNEAFFVNLRSRVVEF